MIDFARCSEKELWVYVASELCKRGIETVLVGGAVVAIYSQGVYQSGDLDFVLRSLLINREQLQQALSEIGFQPQGRHFVHPECNHLFVEFSGTYPLAIGSDYSIRPRKIQHQGVEIQILSPTDCVKDRLAGFAYFSDYDCLDQATLIAVKQDVDFSSIQDWCANEGQSEAYARFMNRLKLLQASKGDLQDG